MMSVPRVSQQKPRLLSPDVIKGFEKIGMASDIPANKLALIFQLRAVVRELVGHLNALEEIEASPNHAGVAGDSPRRKS